MGADGATPGELTKFRVEAHDKPDYSDGAVETYEAYVNPAEVTVAHPIRKPVTRYLEYTGTTEPYEAVELRARHPRLAILVLSQYVEERYATELLAGDSRGLGYLLKDRVAEVGEFVGAVERVAGGGTALDPDVVTQLLARTRRADPLAALTPREREVLQLMAEGRSNTAIAATLVVSEGAVEKHTSSIFSKLGLAPTDAGHRRVLAVLRYLEG